jgi:DNA polymerase I-like protein with 3'-5' exonuclease and polymerase domains
VKYGKAVCELCDHPALSAAVDYAHTEKLLSGFVAKLEDAGDMPIHANVHVLGADTGRMSASGPNLHQQPREPGVRECFVARPGFVLVSCDYDGQEVRGMGEIRTIKLGKSMLADKYRDDPGFDPHGYFAGTMYGISYAQALALKQTKDPIFKERRQIAKSANLGFQYGMGPAKYMAYAKGYGVNVDFASAKQLHGQYRAVWPDARDLFNLVANMTKHGEIQVSVPYVGRLRGGCGYTQVGNTWVQGFCADITKSALWEVTKRCYGAPGTEGSALYGCRPLIVPHDEILMEAPEEYAHEAAVELEQVMNAAQEELTPHVPSRASPALMRNWSKGADAAFGPDGRYICWEDRKKEKAA